MIDRLPIRVRVGAAFALAMAIVLAGTALFLYLRLDSHLSVALDRDLRLRVQDLGALVRDSPGLLAATSGGQIERGESYAQLVDTSGRVLDATTPLGTAPVLESTELSRAFSHEVFGERATVHGLDEPSRFLATRVTVKGRPRVLVVGATLGDRSETLAELRNELLIAGPVALLLATGLGYLLAGFALRPVEAMRRRASAISASTPGERLPVPTTGDELERLGTTLNQMLDRLETALERERAFVADAGHELRTPLALLRTELELALRHGEGEDELRGAMSRAMGEVERLGRLSDDLLLIARADRGELPLKYEDISVATLFATVAARFERQASQLGKEIRVAGAVRRVRGDRLRLEQALANLTDNALRHGERFVRLESVATSDAVELHVRDDGPGIPPEFAALAFQRFSRADQARTGPGSGLGLAIVRTIAEAHGGTAQAAGSDVWLTLPG